MRKVDLSDYPVEIKISEVNAQTGEVKDKVVKDSMESMKAIINVLFSEHQQLNALELLDRSKLKEKLEAAQKSSGMALLEEDEWNNLVGAFKKHKGFNQYAITLVDRIMNAPKVEVEVKKEG